MAVETTNILDMLSRRKDQRLVGSVEHGVTANPDTTAKQQAAAGQLNLPIDFVERNTDEVTQIQSSQDILQKLKKTKHLRKSFQNSEFAKVAHDDVDQLSGVEKALNVGQAIGVGAAQATLGISESIWRTPEAVGRVMDAITKVSGIKALSDWVVDKGWDPFAFNAPGGAWKGLLGGATNASEIANRIGDSNELLSKTFEPFKRMAEKGQQADTALSQALSGDVGPLADVLTDPEAWAGFIGQAAPSLYAAYKSGGSIPFIAWLESMETANTAADFEARTGEKIDPIKFTQAAAQVALINSYLERTGLEKVFGNKGKGFLSSTIKGFMFESGTEGLQQFNSNVAALAAFDPDQQVSEGILGSMMGGGGAGAAGGAFSAMGRASGPESEFSGSLDRSEAATMGAERLAAQVEAVAESKLRERSPEQFREFIEQQVGAEDAVYMAPEDAQAFFQSHPEVMAALPEDSSAAITEALTNESPVAVTIPDYLTYFTDFHEEIADLLRNDIDGMNAREASQWAETAQDDFEFAAEKILNEMDAESEFAQSADRVATRLKEQLVATGRMTPENAEASVQIHKAFAVALADKMKITPEEVYEKFGLNVAGAPLVDVEAFNQAANRSGLVVAYRHPESSEVLSGKTGEMHFHLIDRITDEQGFIGFSEDGMGFANEDGEFYTRKEAFDLVKKAFPDHEGIGPEGDFLESAGYNIETGADSGNILAQGPINLRDEIPGLKQIWGYLTEPERKKLNRGTASKLVDLFEQMPDAKEMASVAYSGRAKRGWYERSARALVEVFGVEDAPRFAALLAAMSPQTSVENNAINALNTWANWIKAGRPTERNAIIEVMGQSVQGSKGVGSVLDAWKNNSIRALTAEDAEAIVISGPKVNSFMLNLRGVVNEVTNDAWMANYALMEQSLFGGSINAAGTDPGKVPGYMAMTATVRKAAQIISQRTGDEWTPAEVQETVWSWAKTIYEKRDSAGEDRTVVQLLAAGGLRHEDISDTPDFEILFVEGVYRNILEESGYGEQLKETERAVAGRKQSSERDGDRGDAASAEGAGITEGSFERHLKQAGQRLEQLRSQRREDPSLTTLYQADPSYAEALSLKAEHLFDPKGPDYHEIYRQTGHWVDNSTENPYAETFDQTKQGDNRGQIQFTDQGALITLLENADLSTFLHESGHFFFEAYKTLATENEAIRADMDALLDFVGIDSLETWNGMTLEERRDGHEKVARAFEAYLFEGKSPSLEMQSVFNTYLSWLKQVYKNLRGLNIQLTDEVREVFDRMLATEEQIRAKEVANNYQATFESQEEAGMTTNQWQDYQSLEERRRAEAEGTLAKRSLADMKWLSNAKSAVLRALQADARDKRKEMKARVTEELKASRVYRAIDFVRNGNLFDLDGFNMVKVDKHKLSREGFIADYPQYDIPRGWTEPGGLPAPSVAEVLGGWSSGEEMVETMLNAAPLKAQIERVTDQRMLKEYGDLTDPVAMDRAAEEAVHNQAHTRFLHTELSHLAKQTSVGPVLHRAAKAFAEQAINRMKVRNIKPNQYSQAEKRAARLSERALRQGDRQSAAEHKRAQVLQNHFWRAANNAKKEAEKALRYLRKFNNPGTRKNLDREYLSQIDAALEKVELRKSKAGAKESQAFADWMKQHEGEGIISRPGFVEDLPTHYSEMTYEELMGLRDHVKNIDHVARHKQKILIAGELQDFNDNINAAHEEALDVNPQKTDPEDATPKKYEQPISWWRQGSAWLMKIEFLAERLDGDKPNGRWWNMIFRPIADAEDTENEMLEALHGPLTEIFKADTFKNLGKKIFINNKAGSFDRNQIISMALNTGNTYNLDAMVAGFEKKNQQISHADVMRILNENLTVEDWQTVQQVWDLINTYWPAIEELQYKLTGVKPEKVKADPFTTASGVEMEGGYYPLVFDSKMSKKAFQREQKLNTVELLETNFLQPTTRQGHINERKNSNGQWVTLDIGVITQHLNNVIHDLSFREALLSVDKVIQDGRTEDAVTRIMSREMYNELRPWLAAVAKPNPAMMNPGERIAKALRKNTTIVSMGLKFTTAWMQPLGISQSVDLLGAGVVMKEVGKFFDNPAEGKRMWKEAKEKSAFIRNRQQSFDRDIGDALKKLKGEVGAVKRMQEVAFAHIGFMDMVVSVPTWHAGYNKAISEGMSEVDAIAMGDRAVRMSQSSGSAKDLSRFQQGNEYQKLYGMFYTYFNGYHNMTRRRLAIEGRKPWSLKKVMNHSLSFLYLSILPAVLSELMVGRGPDDEDDEEFAAWAAMEVLRYPAMGIPFGRDIVSAATTKWGYNISPVAKGIEDIVKLTTVPAEFWEEEADEGTAKAMFMGTGYLFGLPARQAWTIVDNTMALAEGDDLKLSEMLMLQEQRE